MGRIKTALIKRVTHDLMDSYGDKFTDDFGKNKVLVEQYANVPSSKMRNVIAGYITRLVRSRAVAS